MDALGAAMTNDSWTAIAKHVLQVEKPEAELVLRALVQFVALETPPPQVGEYNFLI